MRDKRPVDELSIEELERILAIRKREARLNRLRSYEGRRIKVGQNGVADQPPFPTEQVEPEYAPETELPPALPPTPAPDAPAVPTPEAYYYEGIPQFEDELDAQRESHAGPGSRGRRFHTWWNRALTGIEIAAVIGLAVLFIGLFQSFQEITAKTANLQAEFEATSRAQYVPPTPTPVINIAAVVLPSGHTFKGDEAVFNLEEIPIQYRDQYLAFAQQLPISRPTPSPEGPIRIRIPRIGVDSAVVAGDDWEALKLGVGHHIGSKNPGERGNMVLSAHNDVYGEIFRHLDKLLPGDEIVVSTLTRDYTYIVQPNQENGQVKGHRLVQPTDTWVLGSQGDTRLLTLISCYPYRVNTRRIIVFATLLT